MKEMKSVKTTVLLLLSLLVMTSGVFANGKSDRAVNEQPQAEEVKVEISPTEIADLGEFDLEETIASYASRDYVYQPLPERGFNFFKIADNAYFVHDNFEHMVFFVTDNGVVVYDPVPGVSPYTLELIPQITDKPITHVIYSHHHADHSQGAYLYPESATLIANKDVAELIRIADDPMRPMPDVTWEDEYVLETGGLTLELKDLGRNWHSQKDIVAYAPEQKILFTIDMFHPDAAPWIHFGESSDPDFAFQLPELLLNTYDFNFVISGHERIVGTREHMALYGEMVNDMKRILLEVVMSPGYQAQVKEVETRYDESAAHFVYKANIMNASEMAAQKYIEAWSGKVRNVTLNAVENMQTLFMHLVVLDPPIREMMAMQEQMASEGQHAH